MLSANMAKYSASVEGQPDLFDQLTVTEEDRPVFERFCKAHSYAYTKIQGLAKTIDPAFLFDEGITIVDWVGNTNILRDISPEGMEPSIRLWQQSIPIQRLIQLTGKRCLIISRQEKGSHS